MSKHPTRLPRESPRTRPAAASTRAVGPERPADPAPVVVESIDDRLARLLDTPFLARVVPHLAPETLHQIIRYRGLDACGELVAAATPEQLTSVFDLDLWPSARPGHDERFDEDRFGEWLELFAEVGEAVAARTVAALDQSLVVTGLSRYIRVFDPGIFEPTAQTDDEPIDLGLTSFSGMECKVGGYVVRARRTDAWDAIVTLLFALEAGHGAYFHAVMTECRRLSNSLPEIDGLDDLLTEPEQQVHDVALERERRRSQQGYSTPADARAFLQMARQRRDQPSSGAPSVNPIAAAYFRSADETAASTDLAARTQPPDTLARATISAARDAIVDLLSEAGLVPERPRALLEGTAPQSSRLTRIRPLMAYLHDTDDQAYFARNRELAFLANTLIAGCTVQSRPFTARDASDAAVAICNLGLEHWPGAARRDAASTTDAGSPLPDSFLMDHDLVAAFEVGWAVLHEEVSLFVADQLIVTLTGLRSVDREIQRGLRALRRELVRQRDAGTPWHARPALDVLALLDMPAWAGVLGLLDECPVLPEAVIAILGRHKGAVSATAFEFIATTGQLGEVRAFMARLLDVLMR